MTTLTHSSLKVLATVTFGFAFVTHAHANEGFEVCMAAIQNNDVSKIQREAKTIMRFNFFAPNKLDNAKACVFAAFGTDIVFDPTQDQFVTAGEKAASDKKKLDEIAGKRQKEREAADRLALAIQRQKDLEAEQIRLEKMQEQRRIAVIKATVNACRNLYRTSPERALTNPVCHPIFLEVGLP